MRYVYVYVFFLSLFTTINIGSATSEDSEPTEGSLSKKRADSRGGIFNMIADDEEGDETDTSAEAPDKAEFKEYLSEDLLSKLPKEDLVALVVKNQTSRKALKEKFSEETYLKLGRTPSGRYTKYANMPGKTDDINRCGASFWTVARNCLYTVGFLVEASAIIIDWTAQIKTGTFSEELITKLGDATTILFTLAPVIAGLGVGANTQIKKREKHLEDYADEINTRVLKREPLYAENKPKKPDAGSKGDSGKKADGKKKEEEV